MTSLNVSVSNIFKLSGLISSSIVKLFYMLSCFQSSACSATGWAIWLLKPDSFIHPYSWYWSWTKYPAGYWYIGAPYGLPWYALNSTATLGFLPWMLSLLTIDTIASYKIIKTRSWPFIVAWMISSQFFLNWDPIDYYPFVFSVLGVFNPLFSIGAVLTKLPIGAPGYVWGFVFGSGVSAGYWWNWPRYGWFGAWWIYGCLSFYRANRDKSYIRSLLKPLLRFQQVFE